MEKWGFGDGNVVGLMESKKINSSLPDIDRRLQLHSSLVQRLSLEKELEGHQGCVNTIAWNSKGSLLISGSDDTQINIWRYTNKKLVDSINSGHSANIFCTKFIPETSDEVVVSGAGDAEVRIFNLLRAGGGTSEGNSPEPTAIFRCHSKRVKKLAVEVGNPNLVWSASEDGTLRQHDFRESSCCPPSGSSNRECRNVLLDLRCASKKSLRDSPKQLLALKSCDINMARPHQLLIGGSDAFARLYDRRMLPPLSSSQVKLKPPPCVSYFCPMHLSERRHSSLHLTHVAFSPNGEEMLLSYSGEHVYLMDVNHGTLSPADDQTIMMYTPKDVSNRICLAPISSVSEPSNMTASPNAKCTASRKGFFIRFDMHNKLVKAASKALEDDSNYLYGIEACSEVLDGKGPKLNDVLLHECLCLRAALLLKRKWKNDAHMAIRDCLKARNVEQSSFKAHYYMSEALTQLGRHREALTYAEAAHQLDPSDKNAADRVQNIKTHISADEEKNSKENGETSRSEQQPGRLPSWSDMLFMPEEISDTSQDGPRSEREDSDYDNEMELDFETSISGDEGHDESRILRGSLNLRFHPREEMVKENSSSNTSYESSSSACQYDGLCCKPEVAIDMKQRYVGHCNVGTDIKQASFLGQQGEFVASGSDDGRWFIWEKRTGRLVKVLAGDEAVVNCVQCHPFECAVATSGIDNTIKIWTPIAQTASMVAGGTAGPETGDVVSVIEANQEKLCRSQERVLPFEFFERFRMHELAEGSMHPFECAQS